MAAAPGFGFRREVAKGFLVEGLAGLGLISVAEKIRREQAAASLRRDCGKTCRRAGAVEGGAQVAQRQVLALERKQAVAFAGGDVSWPVPCPP